MPLAVRLSLFYASLCLFSGVQLPFFPVWLKAKGLGAEDISYILAATMFLRIAAGPVFAFIADRIDDRRRVVIALAWGALIAVLLYQATTGFWTIFLVTLALMSFWPSITPLIDTLAMKAAHEQGIDYGRVRLWCSITFMGASTGAGWLLEWRPPTIVAWCLVGALAINLAGAYLLAREVPNPKRGALPGGQLKAALAISRQPLFIVGVLTASLIQSTHAVYYAFGTLNWQKLGYGDSTIGVLWSVGILAEITLFAFSGRVVARVGAVRMMTIGAALAALRWTAMAFSPPLWLLFPLQTLHAASYCAAHLGTLHFLTRATPRTLAATAQSLYASFATGIMMGVMTLVAGKLFAGYGPKAYLLGSVVGALALAGSLIIAARWSGGPLIAEDAGDEDNADRNRAVQGRPGC
jgi:PPP family 3-phenylpropionic acid transporter